jgi:hypothetical protein
MGGKRVMDWTSLFQNCDEEMRMESSEFGQYSCTRLLREMEVALSNSEDGMDTGLGGSDEELVRIPNSWLEKANDSTKRQEFLDDLYFYLRAQ